MQQLIIEHLKQQWKGTLQKNGINLVDPISAILIGGGRGRDRKVIFLIFSSGSIRPSLTIKVARTSAYNERVRYEFHALETMWNSLHGFRAGVPLPVGLFTIEERFVLIESALPGESLARILRLRKRPRKIQAVQDLINSFGWLSKLQKSKPAEIRIVNLEDELQIRLHRLSKYQSINPPSPFLDRLFELADNCGKLSIPFVPSHGDFSPSNIYFDQNETAVIDWEDFSRADWPFNDFFHFMIIYSQIVPWKRWRNKKIQELGFNRAILSKNWFSEILLTYTKDFFSVWGIPYEYSHLFFTLFLLDKASPAAAHGPKRLQQADMWRKRLVWYIEKDACSIYNF